MNTALKTYLLTATLVLSSVAFGFGGVNDANGFLGATASAEVPDNYACPAPDSDERDTLFLALCNIMANDPSGQFARHYQAGDAYQPSGPIIDDDGDGRPDAWLVYDASGAAWGGDPFFPVQLDLFFDDGDDSTNDAWYDLLANAESDGTFDMALDVQVTDPLHHFLADGAGNGGSTTTQLSANNLRISNIFSREIPGGTTYPFSYDEDQAMSLAIYAPYSADPDAQETDGSYEGRCVVCVNTDLGLILLGDGSGAEVLLDMDSSDGSFFTRSPNDANGLDSSVKGYEGALARSFENNSKAQTDSIGILAFTEISEQVCNSNGQCLGVRQNDDSGLVVPADYPTGETPVVDTANLFVDGIGVIPLFHIKAGAPDADDDGYTDSEELGCVTGPYAMVSNPYNPASTCDDLDGDGRLNDEEDRDMDFTVDDRDPSGDPLEQETDPYNPDTDGDETPDGVDEAPADPNVGGNTDVDNDGVDNLFDNCVSIVNPNQFDLDGDGIGNMCDDDIDGDDVSNAVPRPASEEGLNDSLEAQTFTDYRGNNPDQFPYNVTENHDNEQDGIGDEADLDDDNDNLPDVNETDGSANLYDGQPTNPLKADTDGDGLRDDIEVSGSANQYDGAATDPNSVDTDGDGVPDNEEVDGSYSWDGSAMAEEIGAGPAGSYPNPAYGPANGFYEFAHPGPTNANNPDTDDDGRTDGEEIKLTCARPEEVPDSGTPATPAEHRAFCVNGGKAIFQTNPNDDSSPGSGASIPAGPTGYPSDAADPRDTDHDGEFAEGNGQPDIVERYIFAYDYDSDDVGTKNSNGFNSKGGNGLTLFSVQNPLSPRLVGTPDPHTTVRIGDVAATSDVQEVLVIQRLTGSPGLICLIEFDDGSRSYFEGDQRFNEPGAEHPCGAPASFTEGDYDPFSLVGVTCDGTNPAFGAIWVEDDDGDSVPDGLRTTGHDCFGAGAGYPEQEIDLTDVDVAVKQITDAIPQIQQPPEVFTAEAGGPYEGMAGTDIAIEATSTNGVDPVTCEWTGISAEFGDATACGTTVQFSDAGEHTIKVVMTDAGGDEAEDSASVTVSEAPVEDTTPPTVPTGLAAVKNDSSPTDTIDVAWDAATDEHGAVASYTVSYATESGVASNGSALSETVDGDTVEVTIDGLSPGTTYYFIVNATDDSGNGGAASDEVSAATDALPVDDTAPGAPNSLTVDLNDTAPTTLDLAWSHSKLDDEGGSGFSHFVVYRNSTESPDFQQVATTEDLFYVDAGLDAATTYHYHVSAVDKAGNEGQTSTTVSATTDEAPSAPTNVQAATNADSPHDTVDLSWDAATDNSAVDHYDVYRDGAFVDSVSGLTYTDSGLTAETAYSYTVQAIDDAGYNSTASDAATVTTAAAPEEDPTEAVTGLLTIDSECTEAYESVVCLYSDGEPGFFSGQLGMENGLKIKIGPVISPRL